MVHTIVGFLEIAHFDHTEVYARYGVDFPKGGPAEPVNWLSQVECGEQWDDDEEIECDVVVVGTGPGGAIVGKELAEQGHAVVFLEEGSLHRRDSFNGSALQATRHFYRGHGAVVSLGNTVVPVLMGKLVGGSTTIDYAEAGENGRLLILASEGDIRALTLDLSRM